MDWIFDNFQIVVLIALAIGSVVKQMAETAKTKKQSQSNPQPEADWEETETTWTPVPIPEYYQPPPVPTTASPPPLQPVLIEDPDSSGDFLRKQFEMQEKARALRENKATKKTRMLEERSRSATRTKTSQSVQLGVRKLLANPTTARKAIVLREIIDKPLGLR